MITEGRYVYWIEILKFHKLHSICMNNTYIANTVQLVYIRLLKTINVISVGWKLQMFCLF